MELKAVFENSSEQWRGVPVVVRARYCYELTKALTALVLSFSDEDIATMPPHCKHVMPNIERDTVRDRDWFENVWKSFLSLS